MVIIAGDIFDKYSASSKTLLNTYQALKNEKAIIMRGNHDSNSSKFGGEISSLELLGALLPDAQLVFHEVATHEDMVFIPHTFDQKTFEEHLDLVGENQIVFLHCNFLNSFTEHADHSLNLDQQSYDKLKAKGCTILLGHEHKARDLENLYILGCTYPTSISDCLGSNKRCLVYDSETKTFESIETWNCEEEYIEMHWQDIELTNHKFVRVVGDCEVVQYPEIVRAVGQLRKKSSAFIIANAVKVIVKEREVVEREEITGFNILELLLENVDEEFREEIKLCL
jgi:metallophosphoesterase superfamily enzyme